MFYFEKFKEYCLTKSLLKAQARGEEKNIKEIFFSKTYLLISMLYKKELISTMKNTKSEIVKIATALVLEKGYNAFSYADIAKKLRIKNAAIHYHFPAKEDLAVAVMKAQQEGLKGFIQELKNKKTPEIDQIHALFGIYTGLLEQKQICALGSMGADIQTLAPQVQIEVRNDYELAMGWLIDVLAAGKEKGIFKFEGDASIQASIIINNLIAGIIVARFNGAAKETFKRTLNQLLAEITP